jgi:hypothetical protein
MKKNPMKSTASMQFGTMAHTWVLERSKFDSDYVGLDEDAMSVWKKYKDGVPSLDNAVKIPKLRRNSKEYKLLQEQHPNRELVFEDDFNEILDAQTLFNEIGNREVVCENTLKDLKTLELEIIGRNELSVTYTYNGVDCKARFDAIVNDQIFDVKTSSNAYNFERDIETFKYYIQVGFYTIAYQETFGKMPEAFNFVVIPNKMPYNDVAVFELDFEYVRWSVNYVDGYIKKFKDCLEKDDWPRREGGIIYKPSWRI